MSEMPPILIEAGTKAGIEVGVRLAIYLLARVDRLKTFINKPGTERLPRSRQSQTGPMDIKDLITKLEKRPVGKNPMRVTVKGTFFPSVLLTDGWWNRQTKTTQDQVQWQSPLQKWFFTGFEQWGPSWDINPHPDAADANKPLLAQLASGDEVNSVAVVITGVEAANVRKNLLGDQNLFPAEVTGELYHRSHLPQHLTQYAQPRGNMFDYCLVVDSSGSDKFNPVKQTAKDVESYSGYLWQCVAPKGTATKDEMGNWKVNLEDVYFVWEHAEISKPEVLAFFQESLQRKVERVEEKIGGKVDLLQRSSPLARGKTPLIPTSNFYDAVLKPLTNA